MRGDCFRFLPLLHDWTEGVADQEDEMLALSHLRSCPRCQKVIAEWDQVGRLINESLLSVSATYQRTAFGASKEDQPVSEVAFSLFLSAVAVATLFLSFGTGLTVYAARWIAWLTGSGPFLDFLRQLTRPFT